MKTSRRQVRLNSDSTDELATSALLDGPHPQLMRPSTQDSGTETTLGRSRSGRSATETLGKPLPPTPSREKTADSVRDKQAKAVLAPKTTNLKVLKKGRKQDSKLETSDTLLPRVSRNGIRPTSSSTGEAHRNTEHLTNPQITSPQTSIADAIALSEKISDLMQQDATKDSKKRPKRKESVKTVLTTDSKPSPLERSRTAFVKATRAITGRLSSSIERPKISKRKGDTLLDSSDDLPHPQTGFLPPISRGRLDRRIAEGENLSNPKVQVLLGGGHIPRKPLPVYESMKSLISQSSPMEDPFSDSMVTERATTPQTPVELDIGLDIDFSRHKNKRVNRDEGFPFRGINHTTSAFNFEPSLSAAEAPTRFSSMTSGLAQHPDVELFSSSPVGFSTPRIRLEPRPDADGKKRLTGVLVRAPSILDFSFEDDHTDDDEPATPGGGSQVTDHEHSLSVKRKSAKEDLRAQISPLNKKPRRISDASTEGLLSIEVGELDTQDHHPLSEKDVNTRLHCINRGSRKAKGLSMFDTGKKEKATAAAVAPRSRSALGNRLASASRPTSILFSRESRAHAQKLSTIEGDGMDIDELQMDDQAYHMGGIKG